MYREEYFKWFEGTQGDLRSAYVEHLRDLGYSGELDEVSDGWDEYVDEAFYKEFGYNAKEEKGS